MAEYDADFTDTDEYNCEDEYYDSHEDDIEDNDNESQSEYDTTDPLASWNAPWRPCVRWKQLRIGNSVIDVSSDGQIKPFGAELRVGYPLTSEGVRLSGTPYRTFTVELYHNEVRRYFVHDLVYQAFNGPPPLGYEVRHIAQYTNKPRKVYSNRLGVLDIFPSVVSPLIVGAHNDIRPYYRHTVNEDGLEVEQEAQTQYRS
jgi:hypothetical protein